MLVAGYGWLIGETEGIRALASSFSLGQVNKVRHWESDLGATD